MKEKITALMLCLLSYSIIHAQTKTDRERHGLKGLVQTVKVRQITIVTEGEKQTESPLELMHVVSYDKAGNRSEFALYDKTGALSRRITYTYDSGSKRLSELATYDARNVMLRKVVAAYGGDAFKSSRVIYDYNEDGTFYRKILLTFGPLGELVEAAEYREDGSLIKKDTAPFEQPSYSYTAERRSAENEDRIVSFGRGGGEYFEPDAQGNWTRGITSSTFRTHASGKKVKTEEIVFREFTYYQ